MAPWIRSGRLNSATAGISPSAMPSSEKPMPSPASSTATGRPENSSTASEISIMTGR